MRSHSSLLLLSILLFLFATGKCQEEDENYAILDKLLENYDQRLRPTPLNGGPTVVSIDCFVRGISSIDEIAMEYSVDLLVRQRWNDRRLSYEPTEQHRLFNITYIIAEASILKKLWVPDLFFANEKQAFIHEVSVPNIMLRIMSNGDVLYSTRFTLVLSCAMNLKDYPFDTQTCHIQLGTFSLTDHYLVFQWKEGVPITVKENLQLPKYNLTSWGISPCRNEHYTGNFSCLKAEFVFNRELGYHLVQEFLPSALLVIASWISFWLDPNSVPGRVTLGVTTLLTTTAQSTNIKHSLPPVSYTKAIDIWLGICISFVFLSLLEFALANYLSRKDRTLKRKNNYSMRSEIGLETRFSADELSLHQIPEDNTKVVCESGQSDELISADKLPLHDQQVGKNVGKETLMNRRGRRVVICNKCTGCKQNNYFHNSALKSKTRFFKAIISCCNRRGKVVDKIARVFFPLTFLLFIIIYTLFYYVKIK